MSSDDDDDGGGEAEEPLSEEVAIEIEAAAAAAKTTATEPPLSGPISMRRVLFAMAVVLAGCCYTLDIGPLRWAAICLGVAAEATQPEATPVRYWLGWLAYGTAAAYCQLRFGPLEPWLALLPIGAMIASFVGQPLAERAALSAALALPASLAPQLSLPEFLVRSAAFGGAWWWWRHSSPARTLWILSVPTASPLALVGALLYVGLTLHERRPPPLPPQPTILEPDNRRTASRRRSARHGSKNHS